MHFIVVLTTFSAFVFHLLVGCCAHHAHTHEAPARSALASADDGVHAECRHVHQHSHGDDRACPEDSKPTGDPCEKKCEGAPCTYVVDEKVAPPDCELSLAGLHWLETCLPQPCPLVVATGYPDDWLDAGPSLRVHLLHRVLLI